MVTGSTGTYIAPHANSPVEYSKTHQGAIAFLDREGHWVHIDSSLVIRLASVLSQRQNVFVPPT